MVERLTRLDASFLYLEEPDTPMHVGGVLILERAAGRRRRAGRPRGGPAGAGAAVPPAGGRGSRAPRQPGLGGRPGLRHRLPRAAQRAAPSGHRGAAARPGVPADLAAAGPEPAAVGGVPGRGPVRTGGSRSSPRPTPRWSTGSARSTSGRCCSTSSPTPPAPDARRVASAAAPERRAAGLAGARRVRPPALGGRGDRAWARSPTSGRPPPGSAASPAGCCAPRARPCSRRRTAR